MKKILSQNAHVNGQNAPINGQKSYSNSAQGASKKPRSRAKSCKNVQDDTTAEVGHSITKSMRDVPIEEFEDMVAEYEKVKAVKPVVQRQKKGGADDEPYSEQPKKTAVKRSRQSEKISKAKNCSMQSRKSVKDPMVQSRKSVINPKSTNDKSRPKKFLTSYFCFLNQNFQTIKKQNPALKVTEVAREVGKTWRELSVKDKQPYVTQSAQDKARYDREMQEYELRKGPQPPKKTSNIYSIFVKQNYSKVKESNPELNFAQITAQLAQIWRGLSPEEKKPFMDLSEQDKLRFQQQMAEFEEKGYYTLPDGTKSVGNRSGKQQKEAHQVATGKAADGQLANDQDDATTVTTNTQQSTTTTSSQKATAALKKFMNDHQFSNANNFQI